MTSKIRSVPRSRAVGLVAGITAAALATVPSASAQETVAATCPPPRTTTSAAPADSTWAQTFTASSSGLLTTAQINVEAASVGQPYLVEIRAVSGGAPTDTVLASANATAGATGETVISAVFATPASVVAGQEYALSITRGNVSAPAVEVGVRSGNPCPGDLYIKNSGTGGAWVIAITTDFDLVYTAFVTSPQAEPEPETQPQPMAGRNIILDANKNKVKKGKTVTLSGQVNQLARQSQCESNQPVQLQRMRPSQTTFTTIEQLQTDAAGNFSTKRKVKKTYEYRAQVAETATCDDGLSNTEKVKVKKK
jgi:hypothetical protein